MTDQYVEKVYAPDSVDGSEGLLAVIVRKRYGEDRRGVSFFTEAKEPLQLAFMRHEVGAVVPAHKHILNPRHVEQTQEVLFVVEGAYELTLLTSDGQFVSRGVLEVGDLVMLLSGGHQLVALRSWAAIYEVKTGPYYGRERDKELLHTPEPPPRSAPGSGLAPRS